MAYDAEQILSHFPADISVDIRRYADESVLVDSRYLFTRRQGKRQFAYCTHCQVESSVSGLKHNDTVSCPSCGSSCKVKSSGRGRTRMIDEAYFVYYEKSTLRPDVVVARGLYIVRDYRDCFKNVSTQFLVKAYYLFEMGGSSMLLQGGFYSWRDGLMRACGSPSECKSVYSLFPRHSANGWGYNPCRMELDYCYESVVAAVENTPFQYSTWQDYTSNDDMVRFFDLYSRYPCIEYLTKLGMDDLVLAKLIGRHTYNAVNWRGSTLQKVLRLSLTKQELKEIQFLRISFTPLFLKLLQISRKDGSNLSIAELAVLEKKQYSYYLIKDVKELLQYTTIRKLYSYLEKQLMKKNPGKKHYWQDYQVLTTWRDYIADCNTLTMDLTQEGVLFPANLYNAHQNTIRQIKIKEDAGLNKKIASRLKLLCKYSYSGDSLLIRPAESTLELIDEGKALHHCAGTYGQRYAKGEIVVLFIRKVEEPEKPYFTVELRGRDNEIMQVRGKNNCAPGQDVEVFMESFVFERLGKIEKVKSRVTVPV